MQIKTLNVFQRACWICFVIHSVNIIENSNYVESDNDEANDNQHRYSTPLKSVSCRNRNVTADNKNPTLIKSKKRTSWHFFWKVRIVHTVKNGSGVIYSKYQLIQLSKAIHGDSIGENAKQQLTHDIFPPSSKIYPNT